MLCDRAWNGLTKLAIVMVFVPQNENHHNGERKSVFSVRLCNSWGWQLMEDRRHDETPRGMPARRFIMLNVELLPYE